MGRSGKERLERARRILDRALARCDAGDRPEARSLLAQVERLGPLPAAEWLALLDAFLQCHDPGSVRRLLQAPMPAGIDPAGLALRSGRCAMLEGNPLEGATEFERAVVLSPESSNALRDLASSWLALGDIGRAVAALERLTLRPAASAIDWANLARARVETGAPDALAAAARAVSLAGPGEAYPFVVRALCQLKSGHSEAARQDVDEALRRVPHDAIALGLAASVAYQEGRYDEAVEINTDLARRSPGDAQPCANAAGALIELERWQEARASYTEAHRRGGGAHYALNAELVLPAIPQSLEEISSLRRRMAEGLGRLERSGLVMPPVHPGFMVMPFYLAYHGEGNRALQEQWARTSMALAPWLAYTAPHCEGWRGPRDARIRVGLVSAFFHEHSIGRTTRGFVERLDRRRFHVTSIFLGPARDDAIARLMREGADATIEVPLDVLRAREAIAALGLDVLFYQDIGMEPLSRWLAHARLAPVQCYSFGHPDTTGLPTMDWFVSSALFEPPGAEGHYSERLHEIPGVGTLAWYRQPGRVEALPRAQIGIPEDAHFHLCAQALFKLHPSWDALIEGIHCADPKAHVGFVHSTRPAFATRLLERFARRPGIDPQRLHMLPRVSSADFHRLLAAADVVLDSTHFNGMNTSLEAFAQGRAVVTLPGALQRGRHTAAMYARLGLDDGVATDEADYVRRAVHFAADADAREAFARRVLAAAPRLFEDDAVIRGFEDFFEQAVQPAVDAR